jgi:hypothetical protein
VHRVGHLTRISVDNVLGEEECEENSSSRDESVDSD